MANSDYNVLLKALLDTSNIGKADIDKVQKVLDKYQLNLSADLDKTELLKSVKQVVPEIERELKKISGVDIKISDDAIMKSIAQIGKEAEKVAAKVNDIQFKVDDGHSIDNYQKKTKDFLASLKNQFKDAGESISQTFSVSSAITFMIDKAREALVELKDVDTALTQISKNNNNLSKEQLSDIGDRSFETASKYGKKATDYLASVQEMTKVGYDNAEAMSELSLKVQTSGDMTKEAANSFIVATDKAYRMNGSVQELTKTMDGINYITNNNAVNMSDLSEGFSVVAATAASVGVETGELAAVLGTMSASTQQSGAEVAGAFKSILMNIRQISDEDEGISAEGLIKYEKACNALGVKLKETKNDVVQTRDAMDVLAELSANYNKLGDNDSRKTELLNSVGGEEVAAQLDSLLKNWSHYEDMLQQFGSGEGSMDIEAAKIADSCEGSINKLSNTWTDTVDNIANTDALKAGVDAITWLIEMVDGLTESLNWLSENATKIVPFIGDEVNSTWGTIGAIGGLLMNRNGIGEFTKFQWQFVLCPPL